MGRLCATIWFWTAAAAFADQPPSECLRWAAEVAQPAEPAVAEQIEQARGRISRNPGSAEFRGRLGMILHAYHAFTAAEACYAEAARLAPEAARWRYYHAVALARLGRIEEALAELDSALLHPYLPAATLLRAELLTLQGDAARAEEVWRRAIELDPDSAPAHYGLGQALAGRGRVAEAIASFERAIEIESGPRTVYALAQAYRRAGRLEDAQRMMAVYQRMDRSGAEAPENAFLDEVAALNLSARVQIGRAAALARSGRADEAIREFEEALQADPDLTAAHSNLIALYAGAGDLERAERHYRQAVTLDPGWANAHFNWGGALVQRGRWAEAAAAFERAVAAGPHAAEARVRLGQAYEALDRPEDAIEQYRLTIESDPLHREAHRLLGAALADAGRIEKALDHLEKAVDLGDGRTASYLEGLSRAHESDGRLELALGYARRALRRAVEDGLDDLVAPLEAAIERLEAKR